MSPKSVPEQLAELQLEHATFKQKTNVEVDELKREVAELRARVWVARVKPRRRHG